MIPPLTDSIPSYRCQGRASAWWPGETSPAPRSSSPGPSVLLTPAGEQREYFASITWIFYPDTFNPSGKTRVFQIALCKPAYSTFTLSATRQNTWVFHLASEFYPETPEPRDLAPWIHLAKYLSWKFEYSTSLIIFVKLRDWPCLVKNMTNYLWDLSLLGEMRKYSTSFVNLLLKHNSISSLPLPFDLLPQKIPIILPYFYFDFILISFFDFYPTKQFHPSIGHIL